jgi:hypothetical protein
MVNARHLKMDKKEIKKGGKSRVKTIHKMVYLLQGFV